MNLPGVDVNAVREGLRLARSGTATPSNLWKTFVETESNKCLLVPFNVSSSTCDVSIAEES